ncbi:MAG: hypothetical protein A2848_03505 [Candidatus Magasanikbacteria bacterium RIFCSPHIGHO2_01_FULL_50_8]|uniref:Pseudouridine synthase RsuA/RluA-like domain-containing protein n=2 Tax=Candidatus Magasanikiibacteriota TaxID=1752731 RepID=A0A1F6LSE0_9BACT|nr:MAG: hypothetical protein A2848_03505 [Candidatus Magasanikbacteria bacterium RIFCSPHIGHO2_01_FULL_50_8]OGH68016.1 MAG: hypothetical protein A3C15_00465 [Candidatus Magasanikbacteria bacterium RIFCSPHIGHO2_02_FULL_50_9b]
MTARALAPELIDRADDFIVINKPAGLLVHPADSSPDEWTLVDWLKEKFPEVADVGDDPTVRPGIVHRLDRDASGLLVVALTQPSFEHLKNQFQSREIEKEYLVLVHGRVERDFGEITLPISRAAHGGRMAAHAIGTADANEAHTEFSVERRFTNATLLRVRIHTGRTHQIRVHLFSMQHPVVGDELYTAKKIGKAFPVAPRLFLHAARLAFTDTQGVRRDYAAPLPPVLSEYLLQLKAVI